MVTMSTMQVNLDVSKLEVESNEYDSVVRTKQEGGRRLEEVEMARVN